MLHWQELQQDLRNKTGDGLWAADMHALAGWGPLACWCNRARLPITLKPGALSVRSASMLPCIGIVRTLRSLRTAACAHGNCAG